MNDLAHPGRKPVTVNVDVAGAQRAAAKAGRFVAIFVLAIVALVMGSIAFSVYIAMKPVSQVMTTVTTMTNQVSAVREAVNERTRKITPAELNTTVGTGWRELASTAPTSGWAAFEPVTDLTWANAIAKAWRQDAQLTRIDIDRLTEHGTVDLTAGPDNKAGYRYISPSQIDAWQKIADRDAKATVPYELMIKLAEQKVTALVVQGEPPRSRDKTPPPVDSHPLPELLRLAKKNGNFKEYPFYTGYMIPLEREGWVWYLNSLSGRESIPRVRAKDGQTYPYRR